MYLKKEKKDSVKTFACECIQNSRKINKKLTVVAEMGWELVLAEKEKQMLLLHSPLYLLNIQSCEWTTSFK